MRQLLIVTLLGVICGAGCVSSDVAEPAAATSPVYSVDRYLTRQKPRRYDRSRSARRSTFVAQPSWYPRDRRISPRWSHIVLHHSATGTGGASRFDKYHRQNNGWDELGYHFVIGNGTDTPDGYVEVGPRWHKQKHGAHCKTPGNYYNEHGIGICLVGDFTVARPTPKQLASLQKLTRFLSDVCGIQPRRVTTHGALKKSTQCPGRFLDIKRLRRALTATPTAMMSP